MIIHTRDLIYVPFAFLQLFQHINNLVLFLDDQFSSGHSCGSLPSTHHVLIKLIRLAHVKYQYIML